MFGFVNVNVNVSVNVCDIRQGSGREELPIKVFDAILCIGYSSTKTGNIVRNHNEAYICPPPQHISTYGDVHLLNKNITKSRTITCNRSLDPQE